MGVVLITMESSCMRFPLFFALRCILTIPPWPPGYECVHTSKKIIGSPDLCEGPNDLGPSPHVPGCFWLAYSIRSTISIHIRRPILIVPCLNISSFYARIWISLDGFNLIPVHSPSFDYLIFWHHIFEDDNAMLLKISDPLFGIIVIKFKIIEVIL